MVLAYHIKNSLNKLMIKKEDNNGYYLLRHSQSGGLRKCVFTLVVFNRAKMKLTEALSDGLTTFDLQNSFLSLNSFILVMTVLYSKCS